MDANRSGGQRSEDSQPKGKSIVRTPFNKFIRSKDGEPNMFNRKGKLAEINTTIYEQGLSDDLEIILNIMHLTDSLLFKLSSDQNPSEEITEATFNKRVKQIIDYVNSKDVFSSKNELLAPGYAKIKQEEELLKSGATGIKGMTVCPRCKKDNIIIFSKQKSSGDEGESVFNTCTDCNNKWVLK